MLRRRVAVETVPSAQTNMFPIGFTARAVFLEPARATVWSAQLIWHAPADRTDRIKQHGNQTARNGVSLHAWRVKKDAALTTARAVSPSPPESVTAITIISLPTTHGAP